MRAGSLFVFLVICLSFGEYFISNDNCVERKDNISIQASDLGRILVGIYIYRSNSYALEIGSS